jgi:hypothetical protein
MKKIYKILGLMLLITACSTDLDQAPPNIASADSLTDFEGVLNAAYYYQLSAVTPMAVMGDFRADNAYMAESPYTDFDVFNNALPSQEDQFFRPFYSGLYKSILSANSVIENSSNSTQIGEAKFLRALSYFKLVKVFGDVPVNLSAAPNTSDPSIFARQPKSDVYAQVISDLNDARGALDSAISNGRASEPAAQALLGIVYATMGDYVNAEPHLAAVANAAQFSLQATYSDVFSISNELNPEIIFATQRTSDVVDEYTFASEFVGWYGGNDSKSDFPLDWDLKMAFDDSDAKGLGTDLRRDLIIEENTDPTNPNTAKSIKHALANDQNQDWIEIRLADVILLLAEARNEISNLDGLQSSTILTLLDGIRSRVGLSSLSGTATTQATVKQDILDERRLELAFEGHRWFDLVRTGTVNAEMGVTINSNYHVFPIPGSEVLATNGVITQNAGY